MRALWMVLPVMLMGCAGMPAPEPQGASLSADVLTVKLSDGTRCTADWRAAGGQGQMDGCAVPLSYSVAEVANPNVLRQLWVQLTEALGADGLAHDQGARIFEGLADLLAARHLAQAGVARVVGDDDDVAREEGRVRAREVEQHAVPASDRDDTHGLDDRCGHGGNQSALMLREVISFCQRLYSAAW